MAKSITGIDHVLIAVRDLDAAAETFSRLGFTVTPRNTSETWHTDDRIVFFGEDYLELISAQDGANGFASEVSAFLERRGDGPMALCLGMNDGGRVLADLEAAGIAGARPMDVSRMIDTPAGPVSPRIPVIRLPDEAAPSLSAMIVQSFSPDMLPREDWTSHDNGATGIASITAIGENPAQASQAFDRLFGPGATNPTDNTITVHTGHGMILMSNADEVTQLHPDADLDPMPLDDGILAVTLHVADTNAAAAVLKRNGVDFSRDQEGTIRIGPDEACGVFLELTRPGRVL